MYNNFISCSKYVDKILKNFLKKKNLNFFLKNIIHKFNIKTKLLINKKLEMIEL